MVVLLVHQGQWWVGVVTGPAGQDVLHGTPPPSNYPHFLLKGNTANQGDERSKKASHNLALSLSQPPLPPYHSQSHSQPLPLPLLASFEQATPLLLTSRLARLH